MKVTVDVDCTPEEARRFLGLPDMDPVHDVYLDKIKTAMDQGIGPEAIERMIRSWAPMGDVGMNMMRSFLDQLGGAATGRSSRKKKKDDE